MWCRGQLIPTVTSMPDSVKISSVGFATKPEPLRIYQSKKIFRF